MVQPPRTPPLLNVSIRQAALTDYLFNTLPYFVTFATFGRHPVFQDVEVARLFVDELHKLRHELRFLLLSYVVMPGHVHLVIVPSSAAGLAKIMQYVKGRFARFYHARNGGTGSLWQSRYYETAVRGEAALLRRIEYIEENPVKASLVSRPEDYPFSSAADGKVDWENYLAPVQEVPASSPG